MEVIAIAAFATLVMIALCLANIGITLDKLVKLGKNREVLEQYKAKSLSDIAYQLEQKDKR
jgi:hypothetical protein